MAVIIAFMLIIPASVISVRAQEEREDEISKWLEWARIAWSYFDPGIGVSQDTGLPRASRHWSTVTDWDLGGYIIAIIYAERMGILPREGDWGAEDRLEKVLDFLENRRLTPYGIPAWGYSSETGEPKDDRTTNVSDFGRLLIALHILKKYRPDLADRINAIVDRVDYTRLADNIAAWRTTAGFYKYYVAHGFKFFGFDEYYPVEKALKTFEEIKNGRHIDVYGVSLPVTEVTTEPVLHTVFELDPGEDFMDYVRRIYLAQELRYKATGKFTAWSEGNTGLRDPSYVYEWIVTPSGKTWVITPKPVVPIIFTRAAFGLHAIFDTPYTRALVEYVEEKTSPRNTALLRLRRILPAKGFLEGVRENGEVVLELVANTQIMIIEAAYYAFKKRVMESANLLFEKPSEELRPGNEAKLGFVYFDPTPLKHSCNITITLENPEISYITQYNFEGACNATIGWMPPENGTYRATVELIADYVLFNKTISKSFDIKVGSIPVKRDVRIVEVSYPDKVDVGKEFSVNVLVEYDFSDAPTSLKLLVKNEDGDLFAESDTINVSGNGSASFVVEVKAPDKEGNLTLTLVPAYYLEGEWVEVGDRLVSVSVMVEKPQQTRTLTERTVLRKQVVFVTVTRSMVVKEKVLTTYTVTQTVLSGGAEDVFMPVAILVCSLSLLGVAAIMFLAGRRARRARLPESSEEVYW